MLNLHSQSAHSSNTQRNVKQWYKIGTDFSAGLVAIGQGVMVLN